VEFWRTTRLKFLSVNLTLRTIEMAGNTYSLADLPCSE
jgi:hypothetical protein